MSLLTFARRRFADLIYPEGGERRDQLEREANFDPLTGFANRRALLRALPSAEAAPDTLVVLFDANNFRQVNKAAGHMAGDDLLCEIASAISLAARRFGYGVRVFRWGGDEFVVLASSNTAYYIRDEAEEGFGVRTIAGARISLTGVVGKTIEEADAQLQARKSARKVEDEHR